MSWLTVIGIGEDGLDGLTRPARTLVEHAEVLVGGERHLAMVPRGRAERLTWRQPITETLPEIAAQAGRRVVVLASGDPLWYGVGALLLRRFGREAILVLPAPSAFSLAAARMGWPLADCTPLTLHGRPLERLALFLQPGARLLILSEDGATPASVAALLTELGWGESTLTVLERMGGPRERRLQGRASTWHEPRVAELNTLAIECIAGPGARVYSRLAGLPDDAYRHDGQITKRVVRAATLAALAPLTGETLWDIGAGCGSIAIEWLRGAGTRAIAIERDPARLALIAENAAMLGVPELEIVAAEASAALAELPAPDAVFLGGGTGTPGVFEQAWSRLRSGGRLVANAVTVAGEARLAIWHATYGGRLTRIAVSEAETLGRGHAWRPLLPVTQLCILKADVP
ncbi:MAG TPA: precorrin-6y C5,15-methyltransferase (decarboxylating) subunit CbiE [Stellaceae bacterium]|nr:precorrin-6y C5,15-methyltransferase (decarboxylating) subunit CbiE [Stellaceae bacterium]